jgi:uncharacterized protein (DUF1684 family)
MRKMFLIVVFSLCLCQLTNAQKEQSSTEFQQDLNLKYLNPEESPLKEEAIHFEGLDFFPVDSMFSVKARFIRTLNAIPFQMKTTGDRLPVYEKYGEAHFEIQGKALILSIFQSHELRETEEFRTHLFLPFTDLSNGEESYEGGRFVDLEIPNDDFIRIDFNKAYNPYCAYTEGYSCTIPPVENFLDIKILAGVQKPKKH